MKYKVFVVEIYIDNSLYQRAREFYTHKQIKQILAEGAEGELELIVNQNETMTPRGGLENDKS